MSAHDPFDTASEAPAAPAAPAPASSDAATTAASPATTADAAPAPAPAAGGFGQRLAGFDARREQRVRVSWPGRVQLPDSRVVDLKVRDISLSGVGLVSPVPVPVNRTLMFAMGTPGQVNPREVVPLTGTLKVMYDVINAEGHQVGAMWADVSDEFREVIRAWIRRQGR